MLTSMINFLHFAPLVAIAIIMIGSNFSTKLNSNSNVFILILSATGILAGAISHNHIFNLADPCFGYAASLLVVALKLFKNRSVLAYSSK